MGTTQVLKSKKVKIASLGWLFMTSGICVLQYFGCPESVQLGYITTVGGFIITTLVGRIKQDMKETN